MLVIVNQQEPKTEEELIHTPVGEYCINHKINYYSPVNFKDQQDIEFLKKLAPDLIVVCAYGLILPQSLLDIPKFGAINIHPQNYQDGEVLHQLKSNYCGDSETAICIIKMML